MNFMTCLTNEQIKEIIAIAIDASAILLKYYETDFKVLFKEDKSPVTLADIKSSEHIEKNLKEKFPEIPVISEENTKDHQAKSFLKSDYYWLVDPLDGTKGFINKNNEFAICIALMHHDKPIFGLIAAPVSGFVIYTDENNNAMKLDYKKEDFISYEKNIEALPLNQMRVSASFHHLNGLTAKFIQKLNPIEIRFLSSALKFCNLIEDKSDIYPCFGKTMGWDIAAGHALLKAVGGQIYDYNGKIFKYKKDDFLNEPFIAMRNKNFFKNIKKLL